MIFRKQPRTDATYHVYNSDFTECYGMVQKCWTGRGTFLWTIEPADYTERTRMRVGYRTRGDAAENLCAFRYDGKRSRVEG
jgi:hypothetical protein